MTTQKINLMDGKFEAEDAAELLNNLFSSTRSFYEIKNLRSQVRIQTDDEFAQKMIKSLETEIEKLRMSIANNSGMSLSIELIVRPAEHESITLPLARHAMAAN